MVGTRVVPWEITALVPDRGREYFVKNLTPFYLRQRGMEVEEVHGL